MSSQDIKSKLAELHRVLEEAPQADQDLRGLLLEVDRDIHQLLERSDTEHDSETGLRERLEALATDFDARHPNTNVIFRELIHALGRMGI